LKNCLIVCCAKPCFALSYEIYLTLTISCEKRPYKRGYFKSSNILSI